MSNLLQEQIGIQQQDSHTYTAGSDPEWCMGPVLLGGCVAAIIYSAAQAHFNTTLASQKQPDVLTLHVEFFRPCTSMLSTIKVTNLKLGQASSFIQLDLSQNGESKCTALATSTNFSQRLGPTAQTNIGFLPALPPSPDFARIDALLPDQNWIPSKTIGDLLPLLKRMTFLYPTNGHPTDGIIDYWCTFDRPERMTAAHVAVLCDVAPSSSDTLLRTKGVFDAKEIYKIKKKVADTTPGGIAFLTPSLEAASRARIWNTTLTMDLQFKRRLPENETMWTFTRVATRMLEDGRMDLDLTICDEQLVPICLARQVMLVLDAKRRFKKKPDVQKVAKL